MFRTMLAVVLTAAALLGTRLQADYVVYSWNATAKKWQVTQTYKAKAQADSAAATQAEGRGGDVADFQHFVLPAIEPPFLLQNQLMTISRLQKVQQLTFEGRFCEARSATCRRVRPSMYRGLGQVGM